MSDIQKILVHDTLARECVSEKTITTWNEMVREQVRIPYGLGPTSLFDILELAHAIHVPKSAPQLFSLCSGNNTLGVLPCYEVREKIGPLSYSHLRLLADLYPGRSGLISRDDTPRAGETIMDHVLGDTRDWDIFTISFVGGSNDEEVFLKKLSKYCLSYAALTEDLFPYIDISLGWDNLIQSLSKNFRKKLRTRERRLSNLGEVTVNLFDTRADCEKFMEGLAEVEQKSWKEVAGTSLTQNAKQFEFHRQLALISAKLGIFRGFLLSINDLPIAHIYGLSLGGIFFSLKTSFSEDYRKHSPGTVLKAIAMRDYLDTEIDYWDFVGEADEHKMQWTHNSYALRVYAVFAPTLAGLALRTRNKLSTTLRNRLP